MRYWLCCGSCCPMLGFCTKRKKNFQVFSISSNGSVFSVSGFCYSALQSLKCVWVWCMDTRCVHTWSSLSVFTTFGSLAWHSSSVFTALLCGCSVVKLTFYLHQTPFWLWLVTTTVQIIPKLHCIMNMRQVRKHPDSTISKVWTVLKWQMITTLNRKLLEKQRE